ncbi:hypothetical protein ACFRGK_06220 [Bacillus subtilis]|uniref:hypothetical protein n=1 Tax=Bacillus subtilis TaxID=1423 RepID=UPI002795C9C3|nr:hypothetical protein [Bacillus subtilis]
MSNKKNDMKEKIKRKNSPASTFISQFEEINNNNDDNNNINVNNNDINDDIDDDINNIINNKQSNEHVQIGIYFEPAVVEALKPLSKTKRQSKFVNAAVKKVMKEIGMLK